MSTLTIRNVPEHVRQWLRERAARNGRSMEAEVRAILEERSRYEPQLSVEEVQAWIDELFGPNKPNNVVEELIAERRGESERE